MTHGQDGECYETGYMTYLEAFSFLKNCKDIVLQKVPNSDWKHPFQSTYPEKEKHFTDAL